VRGGSWAELIVKVQEPAEDPFAAAVWLRDAAQSAIARRLGA
jgi:hypothetical protein